MRSFGNLGERCNGAEHVGDVSEGDHLRLQLHQRIESVPEDLAGYVVNRNEFEVGIHLTGDLLPRDEICMMLRLGDEHHIATAQVRFAPRTRNKVERLGSAAEHHQLARWNVYIRSDARACRLIPVSRHLGKRVRAAMWVRIRGEEELRHRINNALRPLPCCGAVEIVQRSTARLRLKDWIFGANLYGIEGAVCVMPHAHLATLRLPRYADGAGAAVGVAASSAVGLMPFSARIGAYPSRSKRCARSGPPETTMRPRASTCTNCGFK